MKMKRRHAGSRTIATALSISLAFASGSSIILAEEEARVTQPQEANSPAANTASYMEPTAAYTREGTIGSARWTIDSNGVLTIGEGHFNNTSSDFSWPWELFMDEITSIDGTAEFTVTGSLKSAFSGRKTLMKDSGSGSLPMRHPSTVTSINLSGWDTSAVADMTEMFSYQEALKELDIRNLDTSHVTNMTNTFYGCSALEQLDLLTINTLNVTTMEGMFHSCRALKRLDLRNFNTSKVTDMSSMFIGCRNLTELQIDGFDTSRVRFMGSMFERCESLTALDLRHFDTSSVGSMNCMFQDCLNLTQLDLSSFDTSSVTAMIDMFRECASLETLDLSSFSLQSADLIDGMFTDCTNLKRLDISTFNTQSLDGSDPFSEIGDQISTIVVSSNCNEILKYLPSANWYLNGGGPYSPSQLENLSLTQGSVLSTSRNPRSIANAMVSMADEYVGWNPVPDFPKPSVSLNGNLLVEGQDYVLAYRNYSPLSTPSTATISIYGIGDYKGETEITYHISSVSFPNDVDINVERGPFYWTGEPIEPAVYITWNGRKLLKGTDYIVRYARNVDVTDSAYMGIEGRGRFSGGGESRNFSIIKSGPTSLNTSDCQISIPGSYTYTGNHIIPDCTVSVGGNILTEGEDYTIAFENNTDAGTATAVVTGKGEYTGSRSQEFTIQQAGLNSVSVRGLNSTYSWTGREIKPDFSLQYNLKQLSEGRDYTVSYANNIQLGTAEVTVSGRGNFKGERTLEFKITDSIASASLSDFPTFYYTGDPICPGIVLTSRSDSRLVEGEDYTVEYEDNIDAGHGIVHIDGIGKYDGRLMAYFSIRPRTITAVTVKGINSTYSWTGSPVRPNLQLTYNGKTLRKGTDYTTSHSNDTNPGRAELTITGKGNFSGTSTINYEIVRQQTSIAPAEITVQSGLTYTGEAVQPSVTVRLNGNWLIKGQNYRVRYSNNTNAGTGTVRIEGMGSYTGAVEKQFTIQPASLSVVSVNGVASSYSWTGSAIRPNIQLVHNGTVLRKDTDYTLSYSNNVNAGRATVTVTGKGNYTGSRRIDYDIIKSAPDQVSISSAQVTMSDSFTYSGNPITPSCSVRLNGTTLVEGRDYSIHYENNVNVGTATVRIEGIGDYKNQITKQFRITPVSLHNAGISGLQNSYTWTGSPVVPSFALEIDGKTLRQDRDYTVRISNNNKPGQARLLIEGKNNYSDSIYCVFQIVEGSQTVEQIDLSGAAISGIQTAYPYTGQAISPVPEVKVNSRILVNDQYYTDAYLNNVQKGQATIRITGIGDYKGSVSKTFQIVDAAVSEKPAQKISLTYASVSGLVSRYQWTSKPICPEPVVRYNGVPLRKNIDYQLRYTNSTGPGTATVFIEAIGNVYCNGISVTYTIVKPAESSKPGTSTDNKKPSNTTQTPAAAERVSMHRLYNPNSGEHFYTADTNEKNHLVKLGWKFEGQGWVAPKKSSVPVFRLYNANAGDHHYTMNAAGRDMLKSVGWKYEGIGWYSDEKKSVPLYRQYNPNAKAGSHNYTTSKGENDGLVKLGWKAEGIAWYGLK